MACCGAARHAEEDNALRAFLCRKAGECCAQLADDVASGTNDDADAQQGAPTDLSAAAEAHFLSGLRLAEAAADVPQQQQLRVLRAEDMRRSPRDVLRALHDFAGLRAHDDGG